MNKNQTFRPINEIESQIIKKSLAGLCPSLFEFISKQKFRIFVKIREGDKTRPFPELFLVMPQYLPFLQKMNNTLRNAIEHIGIYMGFIKRGSVYLSIEAAEFLREYGQIQKNRIITAGLTAEKSILYGNPIEAQFLKLFPENIEKNDIVLIENDRGEVISVSQMKISSQKIRESDENSVIASNLTDKGLYLRHE